MMEIQSHMKGLLLMKHGGFHLDNLLYAACKKSWGISFR
jgi:hypothetical protein